MADKFLERYDYVENMLLCAKRGFNKDACSYKTGAQPLVLCHFSDVHRDENEIKRIVEAKRELGDSVDDFICTGDIVAGRYNEGVEWWKNAGAEDILITVGNHDVLASAEGFDFSDMTTQSQTYEQYMAPFCDRWGVNIEKGKTYYYKEYPKNECMLIVINVMLIGEEDAQQQKWFVETLEKANKLNYTVVIGAHIYAHEVEKVECNFSTLERNPGGDLLQDAYIDAVNTFVTSGGKLACWLVGHIHADNIVRSVKYPNQLFIAIDASSVWQSDYYTDAPRIIGTEFEDMMNLTTVDTTSCLVKLIRLGVNRDRYLRSKKAITISYKTGKVIYQE